MRIKEVSEKYGLSPDTLRYYEKKGMIPPVARTSGGIRDYQAADLAWVELALCMRSAGLPVEAMAEYVRLTAQGDNTVPDRLRLLERQQKVLLERREQIEATLTRLEHKIALYQDKLKTEAPTCEHEKTVSK